MGTRYFSWTVNLNFPKEDHKKSFYNKNQQSSTNRYEDVRQNVDFGPKSAKNGRNQFIPGTFTRLFNK